jgi:hypothetical protein
MSLTPKEVGFFCCELAEDMFLPLRRASLGREKHTGTMTPKGKLKRAYYASILVTFEGQDGEHRNR